MKKDITKKVEGERIYLRLLRESDATQEYCNWLNDPEVNKYLETREATIEDVKKYIKERIDSANCFFMGIFDKKNDKHIGNIKLEPIDWDKKSGITGILIGDKDYWGKGIGTEATKLMVDYGFNELGLKEIELGVISENKAAIKVYENVGFVVDHIEKKAKKHGDIFYDMIVMKIFKK